MTSINALKLNHHSGLLICDEARYWNPEWMIFYTPEKIRSIIREDISREQDTVMFMGQTGTSSIGDEWIFETAREIGSWYDSFVKNKGGIPESFASLRDIADFVFKNITKIKHRHLDDFLKGKFGFDSKELIKGSSGITGSEKPISDQNIIKTAAKYLDFDGNPEEVKGIFGNSQILAGYKPTEGFRMFYMTEKWPVCEEIQEIFIAQGSGRDTCDLTFSRFADKCFLNQRRGKTIDRSRALFALLTGLNTAMNLTAGVGGYPKIIYINGNQENTADWVMEICDKRSHLAREITLAANEGLLKQDFALSLLEELIFCSGDFLKVNHEFFEKSESKEKLFHLLRGYPVT